MRGGPACTCGTVPYRTVPCGLQPTAPSSSPRCLGCPRWLGCLGCEAGSTGPAASRQPPSDVIAPPHCSRDRSVSIGHTLTLLYKRTLVLVTFKCFASKLKNKNKNKRSLRTLLDLYFHCHSFQDPLMRLSQQKLRRCFSPGHLVFFLCSRRLMAHSNAK